MPVSDHPLRSWLAAKGPTISKAAEELVAECARRGASVEAATINKYIIGDRRPRAPVSTVIAEITGISELTLLNWRRPERKGAHAA